MQHELEPGASTDVLGTGGDQLPTIQAFKPTILVIHDGEQIRKGRA